MGLIRELIKAVLQGIWTAAIIIIFMIMPASPALAGPAEPGRYQAADWAFSSNPDQDANWVLAQAINGGCNPDGTCRGNEHSASGLYEYKPDRDLREREPASYIGDSPPSPSMSSYPHAHPTARNADRDYCYKIIGGRT